MVIYFSLNLGAMRLAIACNLHNITSPYDVNLFPRSMLPRPIDQSDVDDRIAAFWIVWAVYKIGTITSGHWTPNAEAVWIKFSRDTLSVLLKSAVRIVYYDALLFASRRGISCKDAASSNLSFS
jgi:hypothetical protein